MSALTFPEVNDASEEEYRPAHVAPVCRAERKHATILFTDVKSSMDLSNSLALDEWWSMIAALFELMCEGVYRFGGWVGAFTGDGVKAVFESSDGTADHAERACDAALWLRDAIASFARQLQGERGVDVAVRIGVNSGEILAGTIGDRYSRYYTASGYPVAMAKRIEGAAAPGQICLTADTAALLGPRLRLRGLGLLAVKGARAPVRAFELVGRKW